MADARIVRPAIEDAAARFALDADLVTALVEQESGYRPFAHNPEPRYRYMWDVLRRRPFRPLSAAEIASKFPPSDFRSIGAVDPDAEWWDQQASWGLMQIMGAVAREHGFVGEFLTELVVPETNLAFGCAHLDDLLAWSARVGAGVDAATRLASALAAWNGGKSGNAPDRERDRNAIYAGSVLSRYRRIRSERRI